MSVVSKKISHLTPVLVFILLSAGCHISQSAPATSANPDQVFAFQDYLNRDWQNEAVRIALSPAQAQHAQKKSTLIGPDGQPVAYQLVTPEAGQPPSIEFLANIKPLERSVYKFAPAGAASTPATDLKVEDDGDTIRLTNHLIGLALRKKLDAGQGPIASIRLNSGQWVGGSHLDPKLAPTNYTARVLQQGLVFAEVECRTEFGDGSSWTLKFRLNANEPVVEVDETMALGDKASTFSLSLDDNFNPNKLFYRSGLDFTLGTNATGDIKPGVVFTLEPWLRWYIKPEEGPIFSVYRDGGTDMLSVGAGFAGEWVDPKMPAAQRTAPAANLTQDAAGLHLDFALRNGRRRWIIAAPDKAASLRVLQEKNLRQLSLPHSYLIKHGQFPLDLVKDEVLDWKNESDVYPHLLLTKAQADKLRAAGAKAPLDERTINAIVSRPLAHWNVDDTLAAYFSTGNARVGQYLAEQVGNELQEDVDIFLLQPTTPYGAAPHHVENQNLGAAPLVVDAILDSPYVTPELRKRFLAQIAFCSYAVNRPDYWSEERDYSANPNMTTSVLGYRVALGSAIASHPKAHEWVTSALAGLKAQLEGWSDSNGGWLEAPHYAMASYDAILGSALVAHNAGLSEMIFDPKMKKVIEWFGKWSTPPDSRFGGFRHLPPVGNTCINEPCGEFGIVASIWKERDLRFAGEMQWMFHQQKSWAYPGIGGSYPAMAGYRKLIVDPSIPEKAPHWGSELFPNTGVMLRNKYPSDHETSLLLLAGSFGGWRSHWDDDSGSFTLWGKGRIIADDFGYYGLAPAVDHNLPTAPEISKSGHFDVSVFASSPDVDYVSGARGAWQRQVTFVKNDDPLAANYFVVSDTFKTAAPATWRLWFTANKITPGTPSTLVEGKEDVDTDLFFATPSTLNLKTEEKTRTAVSGVRLDGSQGATPTTQLGLIADAPTDGMMTYVLYPRLKTEKPPVFTSLADGKVVRVQSEGDTDYIFQSATPFEWHEGTISFSGKSGAVRFRGKTLMLCLGEAGRVSARGQTLSAQKAASKEFPLKDERPASKQGRKQRTTG
jgi:hypothetical protein